MPAGTELPSDKLDKCPGLNGEPGASQKKIFFFSKRNLKIDFVRAPRTLHSFFSKIFGRARRAFSFRLWTDIMDRIRGSRS